MEVPGVGVHRVHGTLHAEVTAVRGRSHLILSQLPGGRADLADQYRRAAGSVPYNIAEGGGEFAPLEKARFYRMAKRSATECAAVLDHMADVQMIPESELREAKTLLRRIVAALVKLIISTERAAPSPRLPARGRSRADS